MTVLDSRQVRILRWLLDHDGTATAAGIADGLGLSAREVRYRLPGIERYLAGPGLRLERRRGVGIILDGTPSQLDQLRVDIGHVSHVPKVMTPSERGQATRAVLLSVAPEPTTLQTVQDRLDASKASIRRDIASAEPWLARQGLVLSRRPGVGVAIVGPETAIRSALVTLILEAVPADALAEALRVGTERASIVRTRISAALLEVLQGLPLQTGSDIANAFAGVGAPRTVLALHLAVALARVGEGHVIDLDPGQLRSLVDHPMADASSGLSNAMEQQLGRPLPEVERAAITSFLLGMTSVDAAAGRDDVEELTGEALAIAADRLHPSLAEDHELRRSLQQHFQRLRVRLDYGIPVHNPLLREVAERYPDVFGVAEEIARRARGLFGTAIPDEEVGFVTMYLSGAMERMHLWPRRRVAVVCPAGMATVWILVSRIQAEFPQLELVEVVSAADLDEALIDADAVISTVALADTHLPVAVVNPLLGADDIRAIGRILSADL